MKLLLTIFTLSLSSLIKADWWGETLQVVDSTYFRFSVSYYLLFTYDTFFNAGNTPYYDTTLYTTMTTDDYIY
jgi:hypothetical protein